MKDPNIKTKVQHSEQHSAWNVVGTEPPGKFKIARVPYYADANEEITKRNRIEAKEHADFISHCFNYAPEICK